MKHNPHQQIICLGNRNDLIAKQCASMCKALDVSSSAGPRPVTTSGCRTETFLPQEIHLDHWRNTGANELFETISDTMLKRSQCPHNLLISSN